MKVERIQIQTGVVYGSPGEGVRVSGTGDSPEKRQQRRHNAQQDGKLDASTRPDEQSEERSATAEGSRRATDHVLDITA